MVQLAALASEIGRDLWQPDCEQYVGLVLHQLAVREETLLDEALCDETDMLRIHSELVRQWHHGPA